LRTATFSIDDVTLRRVARVSTREQEREGFSVEVQEDAFDRYAKQHDDEIARLFRIAETATKPQER